MKNMKPAYSNSNSMVHPLPIWLPAYPGSGSEMMRDLVNELTQEEMGGADIYTENCENANTVTCKTHFPVIKRKPRSLSHLSKSVIILLRNPCSAIPSYVNFK
jgi:hypothetical protein